MYQRLLKFADIFWPGLKDTDPIQQVSGITNVIGLFGLIPFTLLGLGWLVASSRPAVLMQNAGLLVGLFVLLVVFSRLSYFLVFEVTSGRYSNMSGSLDEVVLLTGVLIIGPEAAWATVTWILIKLVGQRKFLRLENQRWEILRNSVTSLTTITLASLIANDVYLSSGGQIPFKEFSLSQIGLGLVFILVYFLIDRGVIASYLALFYDVAFGKETIASVDEMRAWVRFMVTSLSLPLLIMPLAILAAGMYTLSGAAALLLLAFGLVISGLTYILSLELERRRQQSRQLELLESLSQAFLVAPPDLPDLEEILLKHIPPMFTNYTTDILLFPNRLTLHFPPERRPVPAPLWDWLSLQEEGTIFNSAADLPVSPASTEEDAWITVPIISPQNKAAVGGVVLRRIQTYITRPTPPAAVLPAAESLAVSLGSALYRAETYRQTLAYQRTLHELEIAGQIQESFLPNSLPEIPGWELAALLQPTRQASGDFYDVIPLIDGKIGLLVADVADKGMGAALYMALTRTLLRTYALVAGSGPAEVLYRTNQRILSDSSAVEFVTVFFAILDPTSGTLTYANAGHNPPLVVDRVSGQILNRLIRTGIPLGIENDWQWEQGEIHLAPNQLLILYTDGIPDTQNNCEEFYSMDCFEACIKQHAAQPVQNLQRALLADIAQFRGTALQFDDITLMCLARISDKG